MQAGSVANSAGSVRVIADLPFVSAATYADRPALKFRQGDGWGEQSFTELAEAVRDLAFGLLNAGIAPRDRVCVLSGTRPEWTRAALAILAVGAVVVPIYPSSSAEECAWVVGNAGATMVICESPEQLAKISSIREQVPELRTTVVIDGSGHLTLDQLAEQGNRLPRAGELESRRKAIDPDHPCMIIYTSGTTGPPKGCVLTHRNLLALCAITDELSYFTADDVVYLFLPLAHVLAQIVQIASLYSGATLAYFGGDTTKIVFELAEVRPTFLPSVPRIFEKIYTLATAGTDPDRLRQAVRVGLEVRERMRTGADIPPELQAAFAAADAMFAKVRAIFGGRLRQALSGAAPISPTVLEFFQAAGVPVLEGYGLSESTGIGTVNTLTNFKLGKVGVPSPGVKARIAEDGEVLMAGPHVFAGYWRNQEATDEVLVEGWLHTGDLGEIDEDGFLAITGRKKDILITAGGKNIAPANLEDKLRQSRWISHAVTFGDRKPYLVALITLDEEEIVPWARERGLPTDLASLAQHPQVQALVQDVVDEANSHFARVAQIKKFTILDRDLSQDAGEVTPTLKIKRKVVHAQHADLYDALYD